MAMVTVPEYRQEHVQWRSYVACKVKIVCARSYSEQLNREPSSREMTRSKARVLVAECATNEWVFYRWTRRLWLVGVWGKQWEGKNRIYSRRFCRKHQKREGIKGESQVRARTWVCLQNLPWKRRPMGMWEQSHATHVYYLQVVIDVHKTKKFSTVICRGKWDKQKSTDSIVVWLFGVGLGSYIHIVLQVKYGMVLLSKPEGRSDCLERAV